MSNDPPRSPPSALQLVYGPLSDRHGRKPILMIGLVLALAGSLLAALATTLSGLTAARVWRGSRRSCCTWRSWRSPRPHFSPSSPVR